MHFDASSERSRQFRINGKILHHALNIYIIDKCIENEKKTNEMQQSKSKKRIGI